MYKPERPTPVQPERLGVRELRANLPDILRRTREGSSFVVTSRGEAVAELRPPSPAPARRREPGLLRGRIHMAADFDELPDDVLDAIEGAEP